MIKKTVCSSILAINILLLSSTSFASALSCPDGKQALELQNGYHWQGFVASGGSIFSAAAKQKLHFVSAAIPTKGLIAKGVTVSYVYCQYRGVVKKGSLIRIKPYLLRLQSMLVSTNNNETTKYKGVSGSWSPAPQLQKGLMQCFGNDPKNCTFKPIK